MTARLDRDTTDADLVAAAASGDRTAFAAIYDRYANRLHDFCVGMLRDRDAAADCVQDAFCTAATKLTQLRDADKLRPWLYSIARNEALRHQRERRREEPTDMLPELETTEAGPETLAARNELADLVAMAAGGLSERDQTILDLTYRHQLDGLELAEVLGVSQSNAGTLVHRLRDTVERSLGALLVARRVHSAPDTCPELAADLDDWDGEFTVLTRKRVARHVESCAGCHAVRSRMLTPAALLGGAPVFIPAPAWLREPTLAAAQGQLPAAPPAGPSGPPPPARGSEGGSDAAAPASRRRNRAVAGTVLVGLIIGAGVTIAMLKRTDETAVIPVVVSTPEATEPTMTQSVSRPPAELRPPPTSASRIERTAETTTAPPPTSDAPVTTTAAQPPPSRITTTVTTNPTRSFSPTVHPTRTTEEEVTTEESSSSSTTRPPRRPPTGPIGPATIVETTETTTNPPIG
jgi:RNA polymerase sigma factor (sigma-70 family)